jgi:hypothetical protein
LPKIFALCGNRESRFAFYQSRVPPEEAMRQRIDARVIPEIPEADYAAFRGMIKLLPPIYDTWRLYHDMALRKRGEGAIVQTVTVDQFRTHLQRRDPTPATLAELLRCATNLASREM